MTSDKKVLTIRFSMTNDSIRSWEAGQSPTLEEQAREQAERVARVRYMDAAEVKVNFVEAVENWVVEAGSVKTTLDFRFEVSAS